MKIAGVVAEYNPFHNGHAHHIQTTRANTGCDLLIGVMSGYFVQRGEPAIVDKWQRAEVAVRNGIDLLLELPFVYATQSATYFAQGAVDILSLAGVNLLSFGSETNNLDALHQLAKIEGDISQGMKAGLSPVQAYELLYGTLNANDILALNYLKAIGQRPIEPFAIQRTNGYHELDADKTIASATAIRHAIKHRQPFSHATCMTCEEPHFLDAYYPYFKTLLMTMDKQELSQLFMMDEGIENLFLKQALNHDFEGFLQATVSKRYTRSKIQRTMLHLMMQTKKSQINALPTCNYLRVLACNEKGRAYLKQLKKQGIPIVSRFATLPEPFKTFEMKSAVLYAYPLSEIKRQALLERELQGPVIIE